MNKKILKLNPSYTAEIDGFEKKEWSNIIEQFSDATIYQSYAYGFVRWSMNNLSHIILKKEDTIVAAAQVIIKKIPILKTGIAYIPWGPLWKSKNTEINMVHLKFILESLKNEYVKNRGLLLRCNPCDIAEENNEIISLYENADFQKDTNASPYHTLFIDMSLSLEELRKGLDQKWRNQLNKSLKNDLEVIEGSNDSYYKIFLDLQKEMQERKQYTPGVSYIEFRQILNELPDSQKMKIMICKYKGKSISAAISTIIGNRAIYLLGATADSGLHLNGSNLLQWRMLEWLKTQQCKYYDLGGISPDNNPGVYRFKNRFAGKNGKEVYHIGQYNIYKNYFSYIIICAVEFFYKMLKNKII